MLRLGTLAAAAAALLTGALFSTGVAVAAPPALERVQYAPRSGADPRMRGGVEGRFDYYALVMSWSPTYCSGEVRRDDPQCRPRNGRNYAFVLHGLWPQHERGYPEYCPTRDRPFVPQATIDRMQDIMPSPRLTIHEYRKHGTCSGLGVEGYFEMSRRLFTRIKVPERFVEPADNQMVETDQLVAEFVKANPGLKPNMMAVVCGGPGNRLREIRICFDPQGNLRSCGGNENQSRLCRSPRVFVPPVRDSRPGDTSRGGRQGGPMLPGPAMPGRSL